ncbi:type VI secretion system protein ImpK [Pseudoalteromonas citrea]|uniref:Type VI secretion system protein ImpK n=2 Tax=Pseudoalteromonas citrea TaxID=43655 RepID=A0AAD4AH80_9GAMM|nr:type IVB secretion system protein IcmH/DotU [Pseudoalteromonas citrea]KAF7769678.1 type VI secretion system protein ImpK [Pseudoalteromonas citrea]
MDTEKPSNGPDLLACIAPVLQLAAPLKQQSSLTNDIEAFRSALLTSFDEFEKRCYSEQITASVMQEAKFALTAFVDERVMTSGVDFRVDWMSRPLQLEFFGNNRAGEEFFERLDKLRKSPDQRGTLLEVYFVCLQLGFEGVYKIKGLEQLKALLVDVRAQLEDLKGPVNLALSDNGAPEEGFAMKVGRNVPYWLILSLTLSMITLLFTGFHYVINAEAGQSQTHIDKKIEVLSQLNNTGQ